MRFKRLITNTLILSALCSFGALAAKAPLLDAKGANRVAIETLLKKYQLTVDTISASPLAGLYEVVTDGGVLYTNQDASYFVHGQLFQTKNNQLFNLTELTLAKRNKVLFDKSVDKKDLIVYPAKNEKHVVNVFTDTTCGYCMKLHSEMKAYNDLGITVRYLPFPRSGEQSENIEQMSAIWCAKDQIKAMDLAKSGKFDESSKECKDVILRNMKIGSLMGVNGTPAILLEDGSLLSGYLPANQLLKVLEKKTIPAK